VWGGHRVGTTATDCGADPGGGSPNTWRVRIYGTTIVDGTPIPNTAAILSETTVVDPPRVATGNTLTDNPIAEYSYHITLAQPFAATANTCYWLEVRAPEDLTVPLGTGCRFRWETSNTGDGVAFQPPNPDVNGYTPGDGVAIDMSWVLETTGSAGIGNLLICTPAPVPLACAGGFDTLTESTAGNLTAGGVACAENNITGNNTYARSTNVGASQFEVCSIEMGVTNSGSPLTTTVNLYADPNGGAPSVGDGLSKLGSATYELPTTDNILATVPFNPPVCVPANTQLVVEWVIPASTDGFATFAGNNLGENSATFILSADCAINDYTPMADIGFPDSHWVLAVCGDAGKCDGDCGGAPDCPADIAPPAGGNCDADGDGDVGAADLGNLLANWGTPTNPCADLTDDGTVGPPDLGNLLAAWGQCPG
jgi:hypothetical protein